MSTSEEIRKVYQGDIDKKLRILIERDGMFPLIADWEEIESRQGRNYVRGFEVFHIFEHIQGFGILYTIKD